MGQDQSSVFDLAAAAAASNGGNNDPLLPPARFIGRVLLYTLIQVPIMIIAALALAIVIDYVHPFGHR